MLRYVLRITRPSDQRYSHESDGINMTDVWAGVM